MELLTVSVRCGCMEAIGDSEGRCVLMRFVTSSFELRTLDVEHILGMSTRCSQHRIAGMSSSGRCPSSTFLPFVRSVGLVVPDPGASLSPKEAFHAGMDTVYSFGYRSSLRQLPPKSGPWSPETPESIDRVHRVSPRRVLVESSSDQRCRERGRKRGGRGFWCFERGRF